MVHGHIVDLIEKKIQFIFYPSITLEKKEQKDADNHFNCPIVAYYPQTILNNVKDIDSIHFIQYIQFTFRISIHAVPKL